MKQNDNSEIAKELGLIRKALNATTTGVIITDNELEDNPIIYCNAAFEKISGYKRHEIIGRNCRFLQCEDRQQEARKVIKNAMAKGVSCCVEIRNYMKNGDPFWNELYLAPLRDAKGTITHFIGVQNDISSRKQNEEQLKKLQMETEALVAKRTQELENYQEFLLSIFQTVRESLIVLDEKMHVLSVNDHFIKSFKVSKDETIGMNLFELGNGQWAIKRLRDLLLKVLPSNNPVLDFEVDHDFPHIGRKIMLLNAHRIELEGQYKDRILLAIEDITERRDIERRKDDFLTIASHELKTPLTTVKGFIQILQRTPPNELPPQFAATLEKTNKHVDNLGKLINDLLNVSKIQSGNIEVHRHYFTFDTTIREAVEELATSMKTHNIIVKGDAPVRFFGDESQIIQVVNNLISNAVKYSPEAKEVIVSLALVSDFVKVSVTDFGLGILQEDHKKVFQRFYRVRENQRLYPGIGIGLYVCEQIIAHHGGSIWVESQAGEGATFSFTLPI